MVFVKGLNGSRGPPQHAFETKIAKGDVVRSQVHADVIGPVDDREAALARHPLHAELLWSSAHFPTCECEAVLVTMASDQGLAAAPLRHKQASRDEALARRALLRADGDRPVHELPRRRRQHPRRKEELHVTSLDVVLFKVRVGDQDARGLVHGGLEVG